MFQLLRHTLARNSRKRLTLITAGLAIAVVTSLTGCQTLNDNRKPFTLKQLAKSEIDMVTDLNLQTVNKLSRNLLVKLYKLNPRELKKAPPGMTVKKRINQLFSYPRTVRFSELGDYYSTTAITRAFDPDFNGDRVFALMVGVTGMIHTSYNFQNEFFMLDSIDHQKLYNSARNLESVAWQINHKKDKNNELLLISNSISPQLNEVNLSTERLFSKMIALQDMMAMIAADQNNRTINKVVHGVASTTFLPI